MSENALYNGQQVKIGTCECMYYLRWEDRGRVDPLPSNLNPAATPGLFFRLPFPDEDGIGPGSYPKHNRGYRLGRHEGEGVYRHWVDWYPDDADEMEPGTLQLRHPSGLLVNVPCHHGVKLPETAPGTSAHWNGKSHSLELCFVKHVGGGVLRPTYHCRHCGDMWSTDWESILPFCGLDSEMARRLNDYASESNANQQKEFGR